MNQFKYLGANISEEGQKSEVLARAAQITAALAKKKPMWRDNATLCISYVNFI